MKNNICQYFNRFKKQGRSISEIINKSGVSRTAFYDIMNGKQIPKLDTANKIATVLGVTIYDIFPDLKGDDRNEQL